MATITGTEGNDVLFDSGGQSDLVLGLGGNDTIKGSTPGSGGFNNPDTLDGGEGDDIISTSNFGSTITGRNLLIGGNGNDTLIPGAATPYANTLQGGNGDDVLESLSRDGIIQGDNGNDVFVEDGGWLGNSANLLDGGDGDDIFNLVSGNTIDGGNGFDIINSSFSFSSTTTPIILNIDNLLPSDLLSLGFGEKIKNIESIASIVTGSGDDVISLSRDVNTGPTPSDTSFVSMDFYSSGFGNMGFYSSSLAKDKIRTIRVGDGNNLVTNSGNAKTEIYGGGQQDTLIGGSNDDTLLGGGGDDVLTGGAGNDQIYGGGNQDTLIGDAGNDTLYGNEAGDYVLGGEGDDSLLGGLGNDNLEGNAGNDTILGEEDDDGLAGQEGDDSLVGGKGNDRLYGWLGNDTLNGDEGNDLLFGDGGNDTLRGGQGNDTLTGDYVDQAAGADTFAFDKLSGAITFADLGVDIITDFQSCNDKILLDKAIFTALPGALDATTFQVVDTIDQAATSAGLIVYSQGQLLYNANGAEAGYGEGGQFAILEALPAATLTADHFVVT